MADESPILLQRHCEVTFSIRGADVVGEIRGTDLTELTVTAQEMLANHGRLWIDATMAYNGQAANDEAKRSAGRSSVRIASWEVFPSDLIFCPSGRRKLDPKWYQYAEAAQKREAAA